MTIIGIDVSKDTLVGARINRSGQQVETYQVANTQEAIIPLVTALQHEHKHVVIACESTSDYHRDLALACIYQAIPFRLINPITTQQFVKVTVRGHKTDMSDALIIAKLALQGEGRYVTTDDFQFTKSVLRTAAKLSEMERAVGLMLTRVKRLESDGNEVYGALSRCREALETGMQTLRKYVHKRTDRKLQKLLTSIPGVGPVVADVLITEIGDINRFHSGKSLVAFAGIDPKVKQSGVTLKKNTRITKRGSPHLRHMLYLATMSAQQWDMEFKQYFEKKQSEGKTYAEATLSGARKLAYRVYAVWKRGTPYIVKA